MKVLITFFPIDDMGGIINHHEQLCAGLKELGHTVETVLLMWRHQAPTSVAGGRGSIEHSGLEFDQRRGFRWTSANIVPYRGTVRMERWKEYASQFDLIIWQVAVPTRRKENRGNTDWIQLYDVPVPQIAVIHDGNFLDSYPWLHVVSKHLTGLACVHTCAYNSARHIDVPSAMIVNPFNLNETAEISRTEYIQRNPGFLSVQTWKAWKRVPEIVKAIPYMGNMQKMLAGKGIDYYYLTSKDKNKHPGAWDSALENGMEYLDVITNAERNSLLRSTPVSLDASWSKKYGAIGAHFNRVQVEAILQGAVPVVRDLAIGHEPNDVFRDNYNCLALPWDATPQEFGHYMREYVNLPYPQYRVLMDNGWDTVQQFDRKKVAQKFLNLAVGEYDQIGTLSPAVKVDGYRAILEFFNGNQ